MIPYNKHLRDPEHVQRMRYVRDRIRTFLAEDRIREFLDFDEGFEEDLQDIERVLTEYLDRITVPGDA